MTRASSSARARDSHFMSRITGCIGLWEEFDGEEPWRPSTPMSSASDLRSRNLPEIFVHDTILVKWE